MIETPRGVSGCSVQGSFDVVVIAASWGGVTALRHLLSFLPADFGVALLVVQHLHPQYRSQLDAVLGRHTPLLVGWAEHGMRLRPGMVFVAPPNWHVRVQPNATLALGNGPKVNWTRPAADPLFESVAAVRGSRSIGVVLTGLGRDGARGVQTIKHAGGRVLVQDPATAEQADMPRAALATGCVDFSLPLPRLARALIGLVMVPGVADLFRVHPHSPATVRPWGQRGVSSPGSRWEVPRWESGGATPRW